MVLFLLHSVQLKKEIKDTGRIRAGRERKKRNHKGQMKGGNERTEGSAK